MDISAILTDRATTATQSANDEFQMCLDFNWIKQMYSLVKTFCFHAWKCIISGLVCRKLLENWRSSLIISVPGCFYLALQQCDKIPKLDFHGEFSMSKSSESFGFFSLKNTNLGAHITVKIWLSLLEIVIIHFFMSKCPLYHSDAYGTRRGVTEKVPAVGFCLGSGLFGSYNSD